MSLPRRLLGVFGPQRQTPCQQSADEPAVGRTATAPRSRRRRPTTATSRRPSAVMPTVDRLIAAPSSAAWNVLVDLDAWPQWGPTVSGARLDSPHTELSPGATGVVRTSLGFGVPFVVTEFEPGRHWAWKVDGIPATSQRVQPAGRHTR